MSAQGPPTPEEMAAQFPITAEEAQAISDAMTPVQNVLQAGDNVGNMLEGMPGEGPKLVGTVLQSVSAQANLASQSAEMLARAIDFYVTAQGGAIEELFPPPQELAAQLRAQTEPLTTALDGPQ